MFFLVRTDNTDTADKIQLNEGSNFFGRDTVGSDDDCMSITHCDLDVNKDVLKIKSLDTNPCFIKTVAESSDMLTVVTITDGQYWILHDGDKFGLLPNKYWYRVVVESDDNSESDVPAKRARLSEPNEDVKPDIDSLNIPVAQNNQNPATSDAKAIPVDTGNVKSEPVDTGNIKAEPVDAGSVDAEPDYSGHVGTEPVDVGRADAADTGNVKAEPSDSKPGDTNQPPAQSNTNQPQGNNAPTSSNGPTIRERCMYGDRCYRKNPDHKRMYSHPSDPDYQQGGSMSCPYGQNCRRRDPRHWTDQTHPPGTKPPQKKRQPKAATNGDVTQGSNDLHPNQRKARNQQRKLADDWSGSESENDYDLEDPFLTDGSDEWEPDSQMTVTSTDDEK